MRVLPLIVLAAALVLPGSATSQTTTAAERGLYLTVFRSPSSGIEYRAGHAAVHAGFYPTVLSKDGVRSTASFVRTGATWYVNEHASSVYVSPSLVWSLSDNWKSGTLTEVGFRRRLHGRINGRLGAAVLATFDRQVRVNPTVGLDIKLGAAR